MSAHLFRALQYFLLLLAFSLPTWILGSATGVQPFPGLPVDALMALYPVIVALILTFRTSGPTGAAALLRRAFDWQRVTRGAWYVPTLLLMPTVTVLAYWMMRWTGQPLPEPQFSIPTTLAMLLVFFLAGLTEELGWSAYLTDLLQQRWSALQVALVVGIAWAAWHVVPYVQVERSSAWIGWQCIATVALRVIIIWLYNSAGRSAFVASLFHATLNVCDFTFPNFGSHYNPAYFAPTLVVITIVILLVRGPRTLAGRSHGRDVG